MKLFLTITLICFLLSGQAQDSLLYKKSIDSALLLKIPEKRMRRVVDGNMVFYNYHRRTKQITLIIIHHRHPDDPLRPWMYTYNFLNGELVRISKWNGRVLKHQQREIAEYYLKKGTVLFRKETGTAIHDIDSQITSGKTLAINAPKY
jgi:hypothetical protein